MTLEFLLKFLLNYERRVDPYSWLSTSRSIVVKPSLTFLNILNEMGQTMTIEERDRNAGIAFAMLKKLLPQAVLVPVLTIPVASYPSPSQWDRIDHIYETVVGL
jgi:hypothetical protein